MYAFTDAELAGYAFDLVNDRAISLRYGKKYLVKRTSYSVNGAIVRHVVLRSAAYRLQEKEQVLCQRL